MYTKFIYIFQYKYLVYVAGFNVFFFPKNQYLLMLQIFVRKVLYY